MFALQTRAKFIEQMLRGIYDIRRGHRCDKEYHRVRWVAESLRQNHSPIRATLPRKLKTHLVQEVGIVHLVAEHTCKSTELTAWTSRMVTIFVR